MKFKLSSAFSVLLVALALTTSASAALLSPGDTGAPVNINGTGIAILASTQYLNVASGNGNLVGTFNVAVGTDFTYCVAGCLDFLYQFTPSATQGNASPGPGSILETISATNFLSNLATIETDFFTQTTDLSGAGASIFSTPTTTAVCGGHSTASCDPTGSSWNPGTVNFSFGNIIQPGVKSDILVIRTDATTFTVGTANAIDGGTISVNAYQPAPEPTQVGLALAGLFGVALIVTRKLRARLN
jgi:hypothetical protein